MIPQTTFVLTFWSHIISELGGVYINIPSEYFIIHCELSRIKGSSDKYSAAIFEKEKEKKVWIQQSLNVDYKSEQVL